MGKFSFCMVNDDCVTAFNDAVYQDRITKANKAKSEHKLNDMTMLKYWTEFIQPVVNKIARLVDHGQPCIASKLSTGKRNGGHYHSTASNKTISLNLHNIHIQMEQSNNHQGGDSVKYRHGLIDIYGQQYTDYIDMFLMQCPTLNLTKDDLIELKPRLTSIARRLEKLDMIYPAKVRMRLRDEINEEINIYQGEFASFKEYQQRPVHK